MAPSRRLNELVTAALALLELPEGDCTVALSGGADSAALALLALESGRRVDGVHVDHQFPSSSSLADAAAAVAAVLGLPLQVVAVDVSDGPSPEGQARDARYRALSSLPGSVLTAHTLNDSVETMLINLVRGTGASGLTGIPRYREPNIHRPMLAVNRSTTREIATLGGLPFVDDPMNEDLSLTRNRVRLQVLPLLRELNPQVERALARAAASLESDSRYLEDLAEEQAGEGAVPVSVVSTMPGALADRLLRGLLVENGIEPSADRIERMWSVVSGESRQQQLAHGKVVVRRGAMLAIE